MVLEVSGYDFYEIQKAESKWFPSIIQISTTPAYLMMANPYKKGVIVALIIFIILLIPLFIIFLVTRSISHISFWGSFIVCMLVAITIGVFAGYNQYLLNESIKDMFKNTNESSYKLTRHDYLVYISTDHLHPPDYSTSIGL